jgi:hypothetical protein
MSLLHFTILNHKLTSFLKIRWIFWLFTQAYVGENKKQAINMLQNQNGITVTTPPHLTECARQFYDKLYTPGPIDPDAVTTLLNSFPEPTSYDPETNADLLSRWSADDISRCLQFAPHNSSPGIAGLPYETLQLLFQHSFCRRLFTRATNIALSPRTNIKLPPCWSFNLQTFIACSILNLWRLR